MPRTKSKRTPAKIIEAELIKLGDKIQDEARAVVRVSKDTYDKDGGQLNEGGSLRDSILPYPKGRKLTMTQLYYGRYQKPKELGDIAWNPPKEKDSPQWDNPMLDAIKRNLPDSINIIAKDLLKNIVSK